MSEDLKVKSLAKALHLLEQFSVQEPELGVTEVADRLGITKSNAHNILSTFQQLGYVKRLSSGKYTLGLKMLEYAFIINQYLGYPKAVYDVLMETASLTNEIVYFGIPYGASVLYLYVAHPIARMNEFPYREILGEKGPLYATGIGKAILAHLPEAEWPSRIPEHPIRYTQNTMTDYDEIVQDLRRIKKRGYSFDRAERESNVRCVGVPVYNAAGTLVAGLSTSGPSTTMSDEKLIQCADILRSAALKMRQRIYR
ncbi:MAG: IclR family transcriptional regulator [Pseudoflavonifractor sp.]|nr:IclR family transcriptional regulator [Pseudoflavonifractor sp.]